MHLSRAVSHRLPACHTALPLHKLLPPTPSLLLHFCPVLPWSGRAFTVQAARPSPSSQRRGEGVSDAYQQAGFFPPPEGKENKLSAAEAGEQEDDSSSASPQRKGKQSPPSQPSPTPPTPIKTFKDLAPFMKRFVLSVHPDIMHSFGPEKASLNEACMQDYFTLFDAIRQKCGEGPDAEGMPRGMATTSQAFTHSYSFSFYFREKGGSRGEASQAAEAGRPFIRRTTVDVTIPAGFVQQTTQLEQRGLFEQARALYLQLAMNAVRDLLEAVGTTIDLTLAPELQKHLQEERLKKKRAKEASKASWRLPPDSHSLLRANLLNASPLLQGKGAHGAGGGPSPLEVGDTGVFSLRERQKRALQLLSLPSFLHVRTSPSISAAEGREAVHRLRLCMTEHHDALQLYHVIWEAMAVEITEPGGLPLALPSSCSLQLPSDFTERQLLQTVDRALPAMIAQAKRTVQPGMKAAVAAAAAKQKAKAESAEAAKRAQAEQRGGVERQQQRRERMKGWAAATGGAGGAAAGGAGAGGQGTTARQG